MTTSFVAVDAGGTSTRAIVFNEAGGCLGHALGAGANPFAVGQDSAVEELARTINAAVASSIAPNHIDGVTVAMAGAGLLKSSPQLRLTLEKSGINCPVSFETDLEAMYWSAGPEQTGCALISGTGAAAIGVRAGKVIQTADGGGWLIGDRGSGFWSGRAVAVAVLHHLDETGPSTQLAHAVFAHYGLDLHHLEAREAFIRQVYQAPPRNLAELAKILILHKDDPVAQSIIESARNALVATLASVIKADTAAHVVVGGSFASRLPGLRDAIGDYLSSTEYVHSVTFVANGLVGAAHMQLEQHATALARPRSPDQRQAVFERLSATIGSWENGP